MHWKELLTGSTLYRREEPRDHYYHEYMREKNWERWNACCVSDSEVERLFLFLNQWASQYPSGLRRWRASSNLTKECSLF